MRNPGKRHLSVNFAVARQRFAEHLYFCIFCCRVGNSRLAATTSRMTLTLTLPMPDARQKELPHDGGLFCWLTPHLPLQPC